MNEQLEQKFSNFIDTIKTMIPEEKKSMIDDKINDFKNNKIKMLMFVVLLNEKNMNKTITDFFTEFSVSNTAENYAVVKRYYEYFLEVKSTMI